MLERLNEELAEAQIQVIGCLTGAVFDFGFVILPQEMLLLPFVGLFANVEELRHDDMSALGAPVVAKGAIKKFSFQSEMILSHCFGIGLEVHRRNWPTSFPIECILCSIADVPGEGGDRPYIQLLLRSASLGPGPLFCIRYFESRARMKRIQEIERFHLIGICSVGIKCREPF